MIRVMLEIQDMFQMNVLPNDLLSAGIQPLHYSVCNMPLKV
jgi:hypothetical protein